MKFLGREVNENLIGKLIKTKIGVDVVTGIDFDDITYPIELKRLGWSSLAGVGSDAKWLDNGETYEGAYRLIRHPGASAIEEGVIRALMSLGEDIEIVSLPGKIYLLTPKENQCKS